MPPVIEMTDADLLARRAEIVREFGLTEEGFSAIERIRELTSNEWLARDALEAVDFLLAE